MKQQRFDLRDWWRGVVGRGFPPETMSVAEAVGELLGDDGLIRLTEAEMVGWIAARTELESGPVTAALARLAAAGLLKLCNCDECRAERLPHRRPRRGPDVEAEIAAWLATPAGRFAEYLAERDRPAPGEQLRLS